MKYRTRRHKIIKILKFSPKIIIISYNSHSFISGSIIFIGWFFKRIQPIISRQFSRECNQHFPQRWMNIKEEGAIYVPRPHFPLKGFIFQFFNSTNLTFQSSLTKCVSSQLKIFFYEFVN